MLMSKDLSKSARPAEPAATEGPSFDALPADAASPDEDGKAAKAEPAPGADSKAPPARTQAQMLDASLLLSHWVEVDAFASSPSLLSVPRSAAPGPGSGGGGGGGDTPPATPGAPDDPASPADPGDGKNPNRGGAGAL